jgi:hypothetical protein
MPADRLNRVQIPLSGGTIELPWKSREQLLGRMRYLESARPTIEPFEAVGASVPVKLAPTDKELLIEVINVWSNDVTIDGLPPGVWDLRNALHDDLHDRGAK